MQFQLAVHLTRAQIIKEALSLTAPSMTPSADDFKQCYLQLLKQTKEMFGKNKDAAMSFFKQAVKFAKIALLDTGYSKKDVSKFLKHAKSDFIENYDSTNCQIDFSHSDTSLINGKLSIAHVVKDVMFSIILVASIYLFLKLLSIYGLITYPELMTPGAVKIFKGLKSTYADFQEQKWNELVNNTVKGVMSFNPIAQPIILFGPIAYEIFMFLMKPLWPIWVVFTNNTESFPEKPESRRRGSSPRRAFREFVSTCRTCNTNALLQCSKCKKAAYCCEDCQHKDWNAHKSECR